MIPSVPRSSLRPDTSRTHRLRARIPTTAVRLRPIVATTAVLALTALAAATPGARAQTPAPGATGWRVAATWRSADVALPAGSWRVASGVDVLADGRILVADSAERRITEIAADGTSRVLAAPPEAGLQRTAHLAADAARDRLYVADPGANAVAVFDLAGARQATWGGVPGAAGVAVAPDGRVVATAGDTGEAVVFGMDGTEAARWVVAAGEGEDRVRGVHVAADGTVHAVDAVARRLRQYGLDGTPRGDVALAVPDTIEVVDVALEEDGNGGRVWLATTLGLYAHRLRGGSWDLIPRGDLTAISMHPAVGTVVAQRGAQSSSVLRYPYAVTSASTTPNATWSGPVALPGTFDGPEVVALGADGDAFVLDRARRIQRFDQDGTPLGQLVSPALRINPLAVAAAAGGDTVATDGGVLSANAADGTAGWQGPAMPAGRDGHAVALAVDASAPDGGAAVLLDGFGGRLYAYRMSDGARMPAAERDLVGAPDGSSVWADLDVDAAGTRYVLDRGTGAVHVLPAGGPTRLIALGAPARRLAVGADGTLFTLDRDGWVRRYRSDGTPDGAFDATRFDLAGASAPSDLAALPGGDVLVADRAADAITRFAPDPSAPPAEPPDGSAQCRAYPDKTAAPAEVALGEAVEVRLTVRGGCGATAVATARDILLLLDRSGSMAGDAIQVLRLAASTFIADVDLATSRVGLISFADDATTDVGLTDDPGRLRTALADLEPEGGTAIRNALLEAELEFGRRGRPDAARVIVLFSDGFDSGADRDETRRVAARLRRAGVEIYAIGIGGSTGLMRQLATDDDHHFAAQSARFLYAIFEAIAARVTTPRLFATIAIEDELPSTMRLVPGSAVPAPDSIAGGVLSWTLSDVPSTGLALRFLVEPLAAGTWPTNVRAEADYVDGHGATGRLAFPVPTIVVRAAPTAPPDTPEPTPTPIPSATATPALPPPSPSPTPTATATRMPAPPVPIYIPVALHEPPCRPGQRHADVVLVVDTSSSMAGAKIAAARAAARRFVALLDLQRDRVALVAFDEESRLAAPLGSSAGDLGAALDGLKTHAGTRIDLGLERARGVLLGAAGGANVPAIVLLTDGRQLDEARSIAVADAARADGVRIYAVGLGEDVDLALLVRLAGDASRAFRAPDPGDLERIYAQIAVTVPCPTDGFWGGR